MLSLISYTLFTLNKTSFTIVCLSTYITTASKQIKSTWLKNAFYIKFSWGLIHITTIFNVICLLTNKMTRTTYRLKTSIQYILALKKKNNTITYSRINERGHSTVG